MQILVILLTVNTVRVCIVYPKQKTVVKVSKM